jgi:hypothetical protein
MTEVERSIEIEILIQDIRELIYKISRICINRQERYRYGTKIISIVRNNLIFSYYD